MLKYKCLVLDHDDTVFDSTRDIHFPFFKEVLKEIRPDMNITLEEYKMVSCEPGFREYCDEILKLTEEEMEYQVNGWDNYVKGHVPSFYEGFDEIIKRQKAEGGLVCVVSHSLSHNIERDYIESFGVAPDMIFGWDKGEGKRKPDAFPLEEIMRTYKLKPEEILMVDDLKPGFDMAKKCNVDFAYAGWDNSVEKIKGFMKENSKYYFETVKQFREILFLNEKKQ